MLLLPHLHDALQQVLLSEEEPRKARTGIPTPQEREHFVQGVRTAVALDEVGEVGAHFRQRRCVHIPSPLPNECDELD